MPSRGRMESIKPCFIVSSLRATLDHYRDKLGFELRFVATEDDPFFAIVGRDGLRAIEVRDVDGYVLCFGRPL